MSQTIQLQAPNKVETMAAKERFPVMDDEKAIVDKAKLGDTTAFERLFDRYQNFVWSVAFRMTYQSDSAEDLTQEVFLAAWRKLPSFQGKSAFSTWLYRITVNTTLNFSRTDKRYTSLPEHGGLESLTADYADNPERTAIARDAERALAKLLDKLEKDRRLVFILRELEGLSYEQIAEATGWPVGTVRSRLSRARTDLSKIAEQMGEGS